MNSFRTWWENSDEAHKARHEGDEACALAAWNAAMDEAAETCLRSQSGHGQRPGGSDGPDAARRNCAILIRARRA